MPRNQVCRSFRHNDGIRLHHQITGGLKAQRFLGDHRAIHDNIITRRTGRDCALRCRTAHHQPPISRDRHTRTGRGHLFRRAYPDTSFGRDNRNLACIHATKDGGVDRERGGSTAVSAVLHNLACAEDHVVLTRNHPHTFPMHRARKSGLPRDQVKLAHPTRVQPALSDGNQAIHHADPVQRTRGGKDDLTRRQRHSIGAQKATAVTGNPVRIGNDHTRRRPRHLQIAQ